MNFEDFNQSDNRDIFDKTRSFADFIANEGKIKTSGLGIRLLAAAAARTHVSDGEGNAREAIMLGSNSYLNLTTHPQVMEGAKKSLEHYGYGMGAVSLYAGITDLHRRLERKIADFYGAEDAILFPSGYGTNIGVISALCGENDVIVNDSANHASIFDGCRLSGAAIKLYPHGNMRYLEKILSEIPDEKQGRLIITDGVFSMHGDIARLEEIHALAKKYKARLMVDDAHGLGIVGPTGRGTAEYYGLHGKIDLNVGMLSKVPGAIGGYCAASKEVVEYLRIYSRTYFFSTSIPAPVAGGLIEVFNLLETDQAGREQQWGNINYIKSSLLANGVPVGEACSGIVPVVIGDEEKLFKLHEDLLKDGIYTNVVSYPAVRRKECRLRLCIMKDLSREMIDEAVTKITGLCRRYGII